mgnify:CR=1 FL=1
MDGIDGATDIMFKFLGEGHSTDGIAIAASIVVVIHGRSIGSGGRSSIVQSPFAIL